MPNPNSPIFPAQLPTDNDLLVANRRAIGKLVQPMTISDTVAVLENGQGTRFQVPCLVQIGQEIVRVKAINGDILQQIDRGFTGTNPAPHSIGDDVRGYILDWHHNQITAEIKSIANSLGVNLANVVRHVDETDSGDVTGVFSNLVLKTVGSSGTIGGPGNWVQLTLDTKGRVIGSTTSKGYNYYPIFYKAAVIQGTNAVLGFSFGTTEAPNAVAVDGANGTRFAVASFTELNEYWVQDHFLLPEDFDTTTQTHLDIMWRINTGVGNVTWKVWTAGMRHNGTSDPTFAAPQTVTATVPETPLTVVTTRLVNVSMGHLLPGDEVFFKFARADNDTAAESAELIGLRWNIPRRMQV